MGKFVKWIKDVLAEKGEPSSKRFIGCMGMVVLHGIGVYAAFVYGMTDIIKDYLQTLVITDGGLLGISSVTNAISNIGSNGEDSDT